MWTLLLNFPTAPSLIVVLMNPLLRPVGQTPSELLLVAIVTQVLLAGPPLNVGAIVPTVVLSVVVPAVVTGLAAHTPIFVNTVLVII